jgi:hypothetical protein
MSLSQHNPGSSLWNTGEKAFLTCAADYAYGAQGSGSIPANAVLQFEVSVLTIWWVDNNTDCTLFQVELIEFTNPREEL